MDVSTGRLLATEKPRQGATLQSLPGSVLKPFFLAEALERGQLNPQATFFCRRNLQIAGRSLPCSHPQTGMAFHAEEALAYSCNNYFAELANRLSPEQLLDTVRNYGFNEPTHLFSSEASSEPRRPITREEKQLFVLGLQGIRITPAQLAVAYRQLALKINDSHASPAFRTVGQGLQDSVQYGMAHNAEIPGITILGKTGTANDSAQGRSHGWFAGITEMRGVSLVVVVYLPIGNGGDAAHLAQQFLLTYRNSPER